MFVIGLAGSKGAGKDTVAEVLTSEFGFQRKACADTIRNVLQVMFGFSHYQMLDRELKEAIDKRWGFSPRRAAQIIGTQVGHYFGGDIWIKIIVDQIKSEAALGSQNKFVITDIRYPAEAALIQKEFEAQTWLIKRPGHEGDGHESEKYAREGEFPVTLNNDSDIESLHSAVRNEIAKYNLE